MPTQNTPVAQAHGNSGCQETLPASSSHSVNHQKPVNQNQGSQRECDRAGLSHCGPVAGGQEAGAQRHGQPDQLAGQAFHPPVVYVKDPLVKYLQR